MIILKGECGMLSTNYFIHLFFDYDHDIHYTDTMLALESEAYLWYKLRLNNGFDAALFLNYEFGELKIQTFDGFSKNSVKNEFLKALKKSAGTSFGLYMKNVNKFYLFTSAKSIDIQKELLENALNFTQEDFEFSDNQELPINLVDIGKAEAGIIID